MLQTMIVGSLPRPTWLAPPHQMYVTPKLEGEVLGEAQDDAVLLALADQREAGVDIVTDGEQRRRHYIWGFCEGLEGLDFGRLVKITDGSVHTVKPDYDPSIEAEVAAYFERYQTTSADGLRISRDELRECGSGLIVHACRKASR